MPRTPLRSRALLSVLGSLALICALSPAARAAAAEDKPIEAKLVDLQGERVLLSEQRGRPLVLKFWATWCVPCREQERIVVGLREEIEEAGFRILAVNEGESVKLVERFLQETPTELEVLLDRSQVLAARLGISALPAMAVLDAEGRVSGVHHGLADAEQIRGLVAAGRAP